MESERLTDADFESEPTTAGTDAGIDESNFGGYPDPDWSSPQAASLAPEAAPSEEVAAEPERPTEDPESLELDADDDRDDDADDAAAEAEPEPTKLELRLAEVERERDAERERAAAYELRERDRARAELDQRANYEVQSLEARLNQQMVEVANRAATLQGAARQQFLNARMHEINQQRHQGQQEIAQLHAQHLQAILYDDPRVRDGFYTQIIQEHGLPESARGRLARYQPELIDAILPDLKAEYDAIRARDARIAQLQREVRAKERIASGADAMGGAPAAGASPRPIGPLNSQDDAASAYQSMGGWRRS